jgi:hypothetical protein
MRLQSWRKTMLREIVLLSSIHRTSQSELSYQII